MNVSCPECRSVFRVDPAKIPSGGIRARCAVCGGVISIGAGASIDEEFAPIGAPMPATTPTAPRAETVQAADVGPTFQGSHGSGDGDDTPPAPQGAASVGPSFQGSHGSGDEGDAPPAPQGAAALFETQTALTEPMAVTLPPTGVIGGDELSPIASPSQLSTATPSGFGAPQRVTPFASVEGSAPPRPTRPETPAQRVIAPTHAPVPSATPSAPTTPPEPVQGPLGAASSPTTPAAATPVPLVNPAAHIFGVGRPGSSPNVARPFVPPLAPRPSGMQAGAQPGTPAPGQAPIRPSFPPRPSGTAPARPSLSSQPTPPTAPPTASAHVPRQTAPIVRPSLASEATPPSAPATPRVPVTPTASMSPAGSRTPSGTPTRVPINPFLANDPNAKARRLARALVSDLVTYFPQKRDEGLRNGNLKELFREEIKKSYEEFVDQVGKDFAESTSHFQDALNDILAAGQKIF